MGMKECIESRNYIESLEWEDLRNVLGKIGVTKYLEDLERRREDERITNKNKKKKSIEPSISNNVNECSNRSTLQETDEVIVTQVLDLDRKSLMICEELAKGSASSRSSTTAQRKSTRSDNKRVLRNAEEKYLMENGFAKVLCKS